MTIGLLAGTLAATWLVGAALYAFTLHRQRTEMQASYQPVELARSAVAQGDPEFVALPAPEDPADGLVLRRRNAAAGVHFLPLPSAAADLHWIVRWEGTSLPAVEWPLLAHARGDAPATVIRKAFASAGVSIAEDAAVVEWIPSRAGVVCSIAATRRGSSSSSWPAW